MLINSGNDFSEAGNANSAAYPPLGIISMATMIKKYYPLECDVLLVDGQIESVTQVEKLIKSYKPTIVIVSMYCTGINYAIQCIKVAYQYGAITIVGNDHAKAHYKILLKNIRELCIVSLDEFGEFMCYFLIDKIKKEQSIYTLPNIAYYKDGDIICNRAINDANRDFMNKPYEYIPLPDRTLLKEKYWNVYLENFKQIKSIFYNKGAATGVTTINRARGCVNRNHRCAYCGIGDLKYYKSSPLSFWEDIEQAQQQIQAQFFYECFDNFTFSRQWLKELANTKPDKVNDFSLSIYSSADCISIDTCNILKQLNVYLVNLGLDSGDEYGLRILKGSNVSIRDNYRAVDLLTKSKFEIHASFVLMGMGSNELTKKSLDKTMEFIKYLVQNTSICIIDCALFYPDKCAPVGGLIWNPENYGLLKEKYSLSYINTTLLEKMNKKWKNRLYIDSAEITKDFAKLCGTDYDLLMEYQQKIKEICEKNKISFGYSQAGKE